MDKKLVIVTGAAGGIGSAIAKKFVNEGWFVVMADINNVKGKEVAKELGAYFVKADVRSPSDCELLIMEALTVSTCKKITALVVNAGCNDGLSTGGSLPEQWEESIRLNLSSAYYTCKPALPHLLDNEGRIILMSSLVGIIGQECNGPYGAAKAGLIGYAKNLALELAPRHITVNAICPNSVDTPLLYNWAKNQPGGEEATLAAMLKKIPLKRWLDPDEVAGFTFFLTMKDAGYITGQALVMDGGYSLG